MTIFLVSGLLLILNKTIATLGRSQMTFSYWESYLMNTSQCLLDSFLKLSSRFRWCRYLGKRELVEYLLKWLATWLNECRFNPMTTSKQGDMLGRYAVICCYGDSWGCKPLLFRFLGSIPLYLANLIIIDFLQKSMI